MNCTQSKLIGVFVVLLMLATSVAVLSPSESEAAAPSFSNNPVPGTPANYEEAKLWILGNANGDMVIDSKDITVLQSAIDKNATVDKAPYCDTNNDGKIDSADIEFLKTLIAGTATHIFYYDVDGKVGDFKVYDKINMVTLHRCVVRSCTILANFDDSVKIVGMDSSPFGEVEFNVSVNYPGVENVGVLKELSSENLVTLQSKYMTEDDECLVIMVGTRDYYLTDLETWASNYDYQVIRIPTWEAHPLEGLLTSAYLFSGMKEAQDSSAKTCWDQAVKYNDWAYGYLDVIDREAAKIPESQRLKTLGIYTTTVNYEHSDQIRGIKSGDHENYIECGGNSIAPRFGTASNAAWTMEGIGTYCSDLDVLILMSANCFSTKDFDVNDDVKELTEKMDGYIKDGCKVYAMTWALNGAPFVVQMVYYSMIYMPDNAAVKAFDMDTAWKEYLSLIGWDKRTDLSFDNIGKVCSSLEHPGIITNNPGSDSSSGLDMGIIIGVVVAIIVVALVAVFLIKRK